MSVLRAAVLGLGVGERHLATYASHPGCEVAAICDIDRDRLEEVGRKYEISARFTDYRKVTEDPAIDVVSICSYDDHHVEQAISALHHGKHVMLEKPIAVNRSDAAELLRAYKAGNTYLTSNLILRGSPRFQRLKKMIEHGDLGRIFYIEGDYIHQILHKITEGWRGRIDGYSVVYGGGVHLIDLMRWLVGSEIETVCAMGNKKLTEGSSYPVEDTIAALLRFRDGTLGKTTTTFGPQRTKFHPVTVYGTRGTFVNDLPHAKFFTGDGLSDETSIEDSYPGIDKGGLLPDLIEAIKDGRPPLVTAEDAFRVMDVCFSIVQSVELQRTVEVEYLG